MLDLCYNWTFAKCWICAIRRGLRAIQSGFSRWRVNVCLDEAWRWDDHPAVSRVGRMARFAAFDVILARGTTDRRAFRGPKALDAPSVCAGHFDCDFRDLGRILRTLPQVCKSPAIRRGLRAIQSGFSRWRVNVCLDEAWRWDDHPAVSRVGRMARFAAFDVILARGTTDRRAFRGPKALDAPSVCAGHFDCDFRDLGRILRTLPQVCKSPV